MRPYATEVLADSPVSWWRLGEAAGTTAADVQGVTPGTYVGSIEYGQAGAIGDENPAVRFNPADSEITVADSASLDLGDVFTLEAWVNRNGVVGSSGGIIDKQFDAYVIEDVGSGVWRLERSGVATICYSTVDIPATGWHHVVCTKNGSTSTNLYLDGADTTGTVTNSTCANNGSQLRLGRSTNGRWYGLMDEPAVYNTALSADRVRAHYDSGPYIYPNRLRRYR
jgi:hypothetical protein